MKEYTDVEIAAEVFRVVRANQDSPKSVIVRILKQHFGTSHWDVVLDHSKNYSITSRISSR